MRANATRILLVMAILGWFGPSARTARAQVEEAATETRTASASSLPAINADGTLRLDGSFEGNVDLEGWSVELDPVQGPLFRATDADGPEVGAAVAPGSWASMGGDGGAINGQVEAIAVSVSDVYVGGTFSNAGGDPEADYLARWDGSNWHAVGGPGNGYGPLNGQVTALAVDGANVYVGGFFSGVSNHGTWIDTADRVAKWDGANWSSLGSNGSGQGSLNGVVRAIAVMGSDVYVGGEFTNVTNNDTIALNAADYIARWDGTWHALANGTSGAGALNGHVLALAVSGSNLYVGGKFTNVDNKGSVLNAADYLAMWNGTDWSAVGAGAGGDGSLNSWVQALAVSGSDLYAGGSFANVKNGGTTVDAADYIARFSAGTWNALGSNEYGGGSLSNAVRAIAIDGTDIYVAGYFADVYDGTTQLTAADSVAMWDGTNWNAVGDDGGGEGALPAYVHALGHDGTDLFAGGEFDFVTNKGNYLPHARYIAAFDGTDWSAMGAPDGAITGEVNAVTVSGSDVYVGGGFVNAGGVREADAIAKWNPATGWTALGDDGAGDGSFNGSALLAIEVDGTDVYVGGWISQVNNHGLVLSEANGMARWDGTDWYALGNNGPGIPALDNAVRAIVVSGTDVYAGGYFTNAGGIAEADHVARFDTGAGTWHAMGSNGSGDGAIADAVWALEVMGSDLYVGGDFVDAGNVAAADYIARWNSVGGWTALGNDGAGDGVFSWGSIYALAAGGTNLYVGGWFSDLTQSSSAVSGAAYIARWDTLGSQWYALGSNGSGGGSLNSTVTSIAVKGTDVYVGGFFTDVNDNGTPINAADRVARWDGANWHALGGDGGAPANGSIGQDVLAIAAGATCLFVGGDFVNVNNNGTPLQLGDYVVRYGIGKGASLRNDFESDGTSDLGYFRPATGTWAVLQSAAGFNYGSPLYFSWGATGDISVPGDFDGDWMTDPTVRRPPGGGQSAAYLMLLSSTGYDFGSTVTVPAGWIGLGDTPVVGDFNGDGIHDPGIWRGNTGVWIIPLSPGFASHQFFSWGQSGDTPIAQDVDGDGQTDLGYWRPSTGVWGFLQSSQAYSYASPLFFSWGTSTDIAVMADYDGDGLADPAVVIPAGGGQSRAYRILLSTLAYAPGSSLTLPAGWAGLGDIPVPNDYDDDGKADAGIWRGNAGIWIIPKSSTNNASYIFAPWGASGDQVLK